MDWLEILVLKVGLVVRGTGHVSHRPLAWGRTYFLKGVVTGRERLRLGFITNGFNRIWGPSDDRGGNEVMGGGGADTRGGVTGGDTGARGWDGMGDWYTSCGDGTRYGLEQGGAIGETPIPYDGSIMRFGMVINCALRSNPSAV